MQITINATKYRLDPKTEAFVEEKLVAPLRLLGKESDRGLLEIEVEEAPPHGRSSEPYHLVARLKVDGHVYYAEAIKPTPESAADKVRNELEAEIRKSRGRAHRLLRRGGSALKKMLRLDR